MSQSFWSVKGMIQNAACSASGGEHTRHVGRLGHQRPSIAEVRFWPQPTIPQTSPATPWTGMKRITPGQRGDHPDCRRADAPAAVPFLVARRGLSARLAAIMAATSVTSHEKYTQSKKRGNAAKAP